MRRVTVALVGTFFGTILLVGLKAQGAIPVDPVAGAPLDPAEPDGDLDEVPSDTPGTPSTGNPSGSPAANSTAGPTATTKAPTTKPTTAPATTRTVTGVAVPVRTARTPTAKEKDCEECHNYSIKITIQLTGNKITKITPSYVGTVGSSQTYANRANSKLTPLALSAQTWNVGRASGATYSGNAWELSLKDAMSKAGLPV